MKKGFTKILAAGLALSASVGLVGCSTTGDDTDNKAKYSFYNYDNTYNLNEVFSISGAKLKITKADGTETEITITDDMIKEMPDMTTVGTKTIVIVYDDVEYKFSIEVVEIGDDVTVVDSSFTGLKAKYYINDTLDLSKIKLNLSLSDGTNPAISISSNMIDVMPDMSTEGTKTVTVSYDGQQYSFSFEVYNAENEMMVKLQNFMKDYNSSKVKDSAVKINVEGVAKYLQDTVYFNEELMNIQMSNVLNLEGYQIGKIGEGADKAYMFVKNFDTMEDLHKEWYATQIQLINTDYVVVLTCGDNYVTEYGTTSISTITNRIYYGEELQEITLDEFKNTINLTEIYSEDDKYITIFDSVFAQPIYKAITNAIVNSSMDIQKGDIINAKESLTAKLDIVKTLNNISSNMANVDFYDIFINNILLTEGDEVYVDTMTTFITDLLEITDQDSINNIRYALSKDIRNIRNSSKQDVNVYDMIVELNNIIKQSNGNPVTINQLDIIISGIDTNDEHMVSKFIYSLKDFASVYQTVYSESSDMNYIRSLNGTVYNSYWNNDTYVYRYYYNEEVNATEMIEKYYSAYKSLFEKFENFEDYTSVKTFANDIIKDLRAMDAVNQEMEENGYGGYLINLGFTSSVRQAIEYYIEMYDAEMIADVIDMLALTGPESGELYEVLSDSMFPTLKIGDKVLIEDSATYNVGDIVAYDNGYSIIIHRIVSITEQDGQKQYVCKGDANSSGEIIGQEQIIGVVTDINPVYIGLDKNLVDALKDCSNIVYLAFKQDGVDYIKLIEDLCERLDVEKEYYIEEFKAGNITIFTDLFDKYNPDLSQLDESALPLATAVRNACLYLDSIFVEGTDRNELMNEINKCAKACYDRFDDLGEDFENDKMIFDCIVRMTNTEKDFYANLKDVVEEYNLVVKEYAKMALVSILNVDTENQSAMDRLDYIANFHITAFTKDEFVMGDLVEDLNNYIEKYCDEDTKVFVKTSAILGAILMGEDENVDYNELFAGIDLPKEVEEVDFNKLIKEVLKDKNTYDVLSLNDVKVDYITDVQGNIVKEVLTLSLKVNYDILISSLDENITITIEINF